MNSAARVDVVGVGSLAVAALLCLTPAVADETVRLQYRFAPGERIEMEVAHRALTETTIGATRQSTETATDSIKTWRVVAAENDRITLEQSVDRVTMTSRTSDRGEIRWSSADEGPPPPGYETVRQSLGVPLTRLVIDRVGRVIERRDLRPVPPTSTGDLVVVPLPDDPVAAGATWTIPDELVVEAPHAGRKAVRTRLRYRLDGIEDGIATISVDTTVLTPVDDPRLEARLLERIWDGTVQFDVDAGRVVSRSTEVDRRVVGFEGPQSSVRYKASLEERIVDAAPVASPHAINTQTPGDSPPSAADLVRGISVPKGFRTVLFASEPDVSQPIAITTDERGRLWVVENYSYPEWRTTGTDRVLIFEDADGDGKFDSRTVFLDGGRNLTGIALGRGGAWLTSPPELVFVPDRNRDDRPDGPPEPILDGFNAETVGHNVVNGLMWGPDGWLYGRHGITAKSHVGRPGATAADRTVIDCSIWRVHPTSHRFEVVARGTTNPWGLDYDDLGEMVFTNNVIGHLWHLIPGAHYERMRGVDPEPHVYELMPQCADHLHWAGKAWQEAREVAGKIDATVDALGGGHSHCGGLIYLGDMFPSEWRGLMFMCNTHGKRVNVDRLEHGPRGIVGRHEPDFLKAFDTWFRGIELVSGPDGRVWIADWTDKGECHDHDGVHRTSGRIYTVLYGEPRPTKPVDLHRLADDDLVTLQFHHNDWFCRQARRLLADRAAEGRDLAAAAKKLRAMAETHADPTRRLRGLWGAHAVNAADVVWLRGRLADPHPSVRAWGVRLVVDQATDDPAAVGDSLRSLVESEAAGLVRLHVAGALSRLPRGCRWPLAEVLAARAEDADWTSLALLIWYGLREGVADDPARGAALAATTPLPVLRRTIARRLAFDADRSFAMAGALLGLLDATAGNAARHGDVVAGVAAAWQGRRKLPLPEPLLAAVKADATLSRFAALRAAEEASVATAAYKASALEIARLQAASPSTPEARRAGIAAWRAKLTPDELSRADRIAGRAIWQQRCVTCHMLFGEGGNVGPDLTGSGRADTDYVILNVMDPSAIVPEAWRLTQVILADGRVVAGAVSASDERTLTLRTPTGELVLDREEIEEVITRKESVMPEGLWNDLTDDDVRDLVAYLAAPAP